MAKAMRFDILEDIRREVDRAIREGTTLRQFQEALTPTLIEKGWWGSMPLADLPVSEALRDQIEREGPPGRRVQLGSPRRLRIIYDTNLRTARAAGRWARMERLGERLPFLRYSAVLDSRTRPLHRSWHGTVLRIDDAWWDTHYPPNGWRCRCIVQQFGEGDLKDAGFDVTSTAPDDGTVPFVNKRRPELGEIRVPRGIDPGFQHNVGKAHMRALTPPAPTGPLSIPSAGADDSLPLPPVRRKSRDRLLPREQAAMDDNIDAFLAAFGAARGKPALFTDKLGEPVVISESFFTRPDGSTKLASGLRREAMLLLADTIREPDEIWWHWEEIRLEDGGTEFRLRRRYLARWEVEGRRVNALVAMDIGNSRDGWKGVTAFPPDAEANLRRSRRGVLAWRRPGP